MNKIQPTIIKRKSLANTLQQEGKEVLDNFLLGAQEQALQEALEGEVDEFLGRPWYQRCGGEGTGYRNGYYRRSVPVLGQRLTVSVPRVRNTRLPFVSRILKGLAGVTERLHQFIVELYVRGLSTRDIEDGVVEANGKPLFSRSSVSRLSRRLYDDYHAFCSRDLSHLDVVFLFLDGVYEAVRHYTNGQPLLCAWPICADGHKELIHVAAAAGENQEAWVSFCEDLLQRGMRHPLLIITDGAPGLVAAVTQAFPRADRQRCLVHKLRNIAQRLPKDFAATILAEVKAIYYAPDRTTADLLATTFIDKYAQRFPAAVKCFTDDLEACLVHLKYPEAHRRFIRSTNLLERAFEEEKRRTKILPQHQHERGALGLVFGVLHRTSKRWHGVKMTDTELAQLRHIRNLMCPDAEKSQFISIRTAA